MTTDVPIAASIENIEALSIAYHTLRPELQAHRDVIHRMLMRLRIAEFKDTQPKEVQDG